MGTVHPFPKGNKPFRRVNLQAVRRTAAAGLPVLKWLFLILRIPLYLILYWLRLPVMLVCRIVMAPTLFCWLFAWYAFPEKTAMVWGLAIVSFTAFVIQWLYDYVLMALSPQEMIATL